MKYFVRNKESGIYIIESWEIWLQKKATEIYLDPERDSCNNLDTS